MRIVDRFTCAEVLQRLDDFLDRELAPDEMALVQEHLDQCAMCAEEHHYERHILDGVKDKLRRISAPTGLLGRVRSAIARARVEDPAP
ncbi:MAG TPA: zf-HC2 domain-containing protein [Gemmatimonadales bacterium]|nr:zf-HC2 domain-containing protein [Gemmatimonadales bacterium]